MKRKPTRQERPLFTTQFVYILTEKIQSPRDNSPPVRGDFPEMRLHATNSIELARALMTAHSKNRLADNVVVIMPDQSEFTYPTHEFQRRISQHIGASSRPGMDMPTWINLFTSPLQ